MTRRLATMCLMMICLIGIRSPSVRAQANNSETKTLAGITAVGVVIEGLSDNAMALGLTDETIRTDVELKLRLAGLRVAKGEEYFKLPGSPYLYVRVSVVAVKSGNSAFSVEIELHQNAQLEQNGQNAVGVTTWDTGFLGMNYDAQDIRNAVKDHVDQFLNAWLSVNPKK